jgi:chemotaxis protein MotB
MNGDNPFDKPPTLAPKNKDSGSSAAAGWIIAVLMAGLVAAAGWFWHAAQNKDHDIESLRSDLAKESYTLSNTIADSQKVRDQIAALQNQIAGLEQEKESVAQKARSLEDEMRADLESKDVTISNLQGKLTVNILDRVLFTSGEAVLKPDGETVLRKVAELLAAHPNVKIHVIGHTDNLPIHTRFASNWELSTARALAAVHFLTEKAGFDPRRIGAVGYGEYRPIADNSTEEGRAKNRRIAITILSDELAGSDAANLEKPKAPTPSQTPVQPQVKSQSIPAPSASDASKPPLD